jgi:hypothetical protein
MNATFDELLDTVDNLEITERQMLIDIVQKRINAQSRKEIILDVRRGRVDYSKGNVKRGSRQELMKEILG